MCHVSKVKGIFGRSAYTKQRLLFVTHFAENTLFSSWIFFLGLCARQKLWRKISHDKMDVVGRTWMIFIW